MRWGERGGPMIWAGLDALLTKRPAWVQALVVGLCTGLFVATAAEANQREPLITSVVLLVLVAGAVGRPAFYLVRRAQKRHGWRAGPAAPAWVALVYASVWVLSLLAAARAVSGAG